MFRGFKANSVEGEQRDAEFKLGNLPT